MLNLTQIMEKHFYPRVTEEFFVKNGIVYDNMGCYYKRWDKLSIEEQCLVLKNDKSDHIPLSL